MKPKCRLCTFYLDALWFGVAIERVQELVSRPIVRPVPLASLGVAGLVNVRGRILTVVDLWLRLGMQDRQNPPQPAMVVVRNGNSLSGLVVDEIGEIVDAEERLFEAFPVTPPEAQGMVLGVCKFPRRLLQVLDVDRVLLADRRSDPLRES